MQPLPGTQFYVHITRLVIDVHEMKVSPETVSFLPTVVLVDRTGATIGTLAVDRITLEDQGSASSVAGMAAQAIRQLEAKLARGYTTTQQGRKK